MKKGILFLSLALLMFSINAQEESFSKLQKLDWKQTFFDPGTSSWSEKWLLDGLKARVYNSPEGMEFYEGPIPAHAF